MSSLNEKDNRTDSEGSGRVSALFTDLYELTMAAAFYGEEMCAPATFSLFVRTLPKDWGYFVCAGLDDALDFLENMRFEKPEIDYLAATGRFSADFLDFLSGLRFTGEVRAMREGEIFFPNEPILEVTAPIIEAQIAETYLINALHFQSTICTKASRCVAAADGRPLIDFSLRRTHGFDAGMKAARASHIAGFAATSNTLAGLRLGIPISGTMAHSYITAFRDEIEAFRAFARTHPEDTVLLIDTYDTISGAKKACEVGLEMKTRGHALRGVRLDSGDMVALSCRVRELLDEAGLGDTMVLASGGLDEYKIHDMHIAGALIDGFGVGTSMGVSMDAPSVDMAYKLVEYDGRTTLKLSADKVTLPGAKQVFRSLDNDGAFAGDIVAMRDEEPPPGFKPLLEEVMRGGKRISELLGEETLADAVGRCSTSTRKLPGPVAATYEPAGYEVSESDGLKREVEKAGDRAQKQVL